MIAFLMLNISKTVKDIKLTFCMCVCGTKVFKKRHLIFKEFDKIKKLGEPIYYNRGGGGGGDTEDLPPNVSMSRQTDDIGKKTSLKCRESILY